MYQRTVGHVPQFLGEVILRLFQGGIMAILVPSISRLRPWAERKRISPDCAAGPQLAAIAGQSLEVFHVRCE